MRKALETGSFHTRRNLESALRASIRALEERRDLLARLIVRSRRNGDTPTSRRFELRFVEVEADIQRVSAALASLFGAASNQA